jgi:hypothetical protein
MEEEVFTNNDWTTWMRGYSYFNEGTLYESGQVLHQFTGGEGKEGFITGR